MAREPKVMWSARLPGGLVDQIVEAAEEDGVSQGELVAEVMGEYLDERALRGARVDGGSRAEQAALRGLERVEAEMAAMGCPGAVVVVACRCEECDGVVMGTHGDPVELLMDTVAFATVVAGAAGKQLTIRTDGDA
jgi:hypothetical protein